MNDPNQWALYIHEDFQGMAYIAITQGEATNIFIDKDAGLELAYLLMSICKGQGSGKVHTIRTKVEMK